MLWQYWYVYCAVVLQKQKSYRLMVVSNGLFNWMKRGRWFIKCL